MEGDSQELATHPSLLLRVRDARDSQAWTEFVGLYGPLIFRFCRFKRLQESDALDVAQEVLTRLARSLRTFDYQPQNGRFRDWLGKITYRELLRYWESRRTERSRQAGSVDFAEPAEDASGWNEHFLAELLQTALCRIENEFQCETWQAFVLSWVENRPATEVAALMGIGVNKVYVSQSRVLKRLRAEVVSLSEDLPPFRP